jgi:predicted amidohydrolase YtcJ
VKQGLMDAHGHLAATPLFQLEVSQVVAHLKHHIELLEAFAQMQATIKAQSANGGKEKRAN